MNKLSQAYNYHTLPKSVDDYDNRKENQAFEHVELLQRQRESAKRAESDTKPQQINGLLVSVPRDPYFDHRNEGSC